MIKLMLVFLRCLLILFLFLWKTENSIAQTCVSTFSSISIYWSPLVGSLNSECKVFYRQLGSKKKWNSGLPLWYDDRDSEYRGSIVHLLSGVTYEIKLETDSITTTFTQKTWTENIPIGDTIYVPSSDKTYVVSNSGTPEGYTLYLPQKEDSEIDVCHSTNLALVVKENTSYVMLKGLTLKGANSSGLRIFDNCNDIIITDCDISDWGINGPEGFGFGDQAAIISKQANNVKRIIIQNNRLHHPNSDSNSWAEFRNDTKSYHPGGPKAIILRNSAGNHVIRFNEIYSDDSHYFADGFAGGTNFSFEGFPNRDTDIYGNYVERCWDDGIECEGGNQNVRVWGNLIDKTYVKIAIAPVSKGPIYIWRNLAGTSRRDPLTEDPCLYGRGPFIKAGGQERNGTWYGSGKTYVFHNTILQPESNAGVKLGSSIGLRASGGRLDNLTTRNNIFIANKYDGSAISYQSNNCTNSYDYDLYYGRIKSNCTNIVHQKNGIRLGQEEKPLYKANNEIFSYYLEENSLGFNSGVVLPNFNDNYTGNAPDIGAFENGNPPLHFGNW